MSLYESVLALLLKWARWHVSSRVPSSRQQVRSVGSLPLAGAPMSCSVGQGLVSPLHTPQWYSAGKGEPTLCVSFRPAHAGPPLAAGERPTPM